MAWNVTTYRAREVYCYYLLILKSWRNFPAINTKGLYDGLDGHNDYEKTGFDSNAFASGWL
jgi:hypothetical protein